MDSALPITDSPLFDGLNPAQREGVAATDGPVLVVAGAGSGKTRVLTYRIAHLIRDLGVSPHAILAITFTNKAADEMKQRVANLVGGVAGSMWVSTFHSACVRILRREAHRLGYKSAFSIYDAADSLRLITMCVSDLDLDPKRFPPRSIRGAISNAKNEMIDYETYRSQDSGFYHEQIADVYRLYQQRLLKASAMDFDDLLMITVELLGAFPDVLEQYQRRFQYVLVDEYQDTNHAQYMLVKLLTDSHRNLCVVGDQDQCLPPGTSIKTTSGYKPIEEIRFGDEVVGVAGDGDPRPGRVSHIQPGTYSGPVYRIDSGESSLVGTPYHLVPARLDLPQDSHVVYLMYRGDRGFRLGLTTAYRSNYRGLKDLGVTVRSNQEHADKVWILKVCPSRAEAAYWESRLSADYGIPTACFHGVGRHLDMDEPWLKRLYDEVDTVGAAKFIMDDFNLLAEFPHYRPQNGQRRQSVNLTMFSDRRTGVGYHRVQWSSNRSDVADRLRESGFNVRPGKLPGTFRVETSRKSYPDALELAKRMTLATDLEIQRRASIGGKMYSYTPLAHLRAGMRVLVEADGRFVERAVEHVAVEEYAGPVYDLQVDPVHHYVANGVLVHNSIYKFRGADIRNILEFEKDYPDARIVVLDRNYRSTEIILEAANAVIDNNLHRKPKRLWTDLGRGELITRYEAQDEHDEAAFVADQIELLDDQGYHRRDIAIFYRTNAQSRVLEEVFVRYGIPYNVVGGVKFYERREVRDALAYLRLLANRTDEVAVKRVINVPKRGIGQSTIAHVDRFAQDGRISFYDALTRIDEIGMVAGRSAIRVKEFVGLIDRLEEAAADGPRAAIDAVLAETGYVAELEAERSVEALGRVENLRELASVAEEFEESMDGSITDDGAWATLSGMRKLELFLEQVSLVTDIDELDDQAEAVTLMTLHTAKGLEYPVIFIVGMEDGVFPHSRSLGDPEELEEERRLCYVGVTRAEEKLYVTHAWQRMLFGSSSFNAPSRFLGEIPDDLITMAPKRTRRPGHEAGSPSPGSTVSADEIGVGDRIVHGKWGTGVVEEITGTGDRAEAWVVFDESGRKRLLLAWAPLSKA
jgi:DNA helicase-2/ATP-dependent DNA helicase PcrA